jgi:hypothetical protein
VLNPAGSRACSDCHNTFELSKDHSGFDLVGRGGPMRGGSQAGASVYRCTSCNARNPAGVPSCQKCGNNFQMGTRNSGFGVVPGGSSGRHMYNLTDTYVAKQTICLYTTITYSTLRLFLFVRRGTFDDRRYSYRGLTATTQITDLSSAYRNNIYYYRYIFVYYRTTGISAVRVGVAH